MEAEGDPTTDEPASEPEREDEMMPAEEEDCS